MGGITKTIGSLKIRNTYYCIQIIEVEIDNNKQLFASGNIHEPEANNCFSIITQVIIEIPKQRNVKFYHDLPLFRRDRVYVSRDAFFGSRSEKTFDVHNVW